jgi:hypothetical protein
MMWRLDKDVPTVIDGEREPRPQFADKVCGDVRVASRNQTAVNARRVQLELQRLNAASNVRP